MKRKMLSPASMAVVVSIIVLLISLAIANDNLFLAEPDPIDMTGSGDVATDFIILEEGLSIFKMTNTGGGHFAIWLLDDMGDNVELLVNEIGIFDGSKAVGIEVDGEYLLEVSSDGNWTVRIEQPRPTSAPIVDVINGTGQVATDQFQLNEGLNRFTMTHDGDGHFSVVLMDNEGDWVDLLANDIGEYDGSSAVGIDASGIYLFDISADGNWTVTIDTPAASTTTTSSTNPSTTTSSTKPSTTTSTSDDGDCASEEIYGTDSAQTQLLRSLRDNILSKTHEGRELIQLYYQWSPVIVKAMEQDEDFKDDVKDLVDGVLGVVE